MERKNSLLEDALIASTCSVYAEEVVHRMINLLIEVVEADFNKVSVIQVRAKAREILSDAGVTREVVP